MRIAVDTGGTFTDLVLEDNYGLLRMFKSPTTPHDPVIGMLNAVKSAADGLSIGVEDLLGQVEVFIHGTTHATNAIVTGSTAKTAFLTTRGFPEILVVREGGRIEPFNFRVPFPKPYVPRALTFEVPERIASDGRVLEELDESEAIRILDRLRALEIEAVAVCLLWSTVNPVHENRIGELLSRHLPEVPYTLSHVLNPILREYRRASSTTIDASLKPLISRYVSGLQERLQEAGFKGRLLMLTAKGGVMDVEDWAAAPIHAIGSGPSMAPLAGRYYAQIDAGTDTAIVADTGGTTYDVSLVRRGDIPMTAEAWIGQPKRGHLIGFPSVDVKSIGAGGGSIAWVDSGGLLHVGPQSAGAAPGPACYGQGGEKPTVADAALVLGYIDPEYFLGGELKLRPDLAASSIQTHLCPYLNLDLEEAASAVMILATENMVGAIEQITIQQGLDPRTAVLVGAGGAAGLNAVAVAKRLGSSQVIIPELVAALSAQGALISDLQADYRAVFSCSTNNFDYKGINTTLDQLLSKCRRFIEKNGAGSVENSIEMNLEAHYMSQVWDIEVPVNVMRFDGPEDVAKLRLDFDRCHEELFGFRDPNSEVQFIGWRATARCRLSESDSGRRISNQDSLSKASTSRQAFFEGLGMIDCEVLMFGRIKTGEAVEGPAVIESPFTTIVIEPGTKAFKTENGSLLINIDTALIQ